MTERYVASITVRSYCRVPMCQLCFACIDLIFGALAYWRFGECFRQSLLPLFDNKARAAIIGCLLLQSELLQDEIYVNNF